MKFRVKKWMGLAALSTAMTIGAAGGFAYSQMTHADLVKAETANYYAERSNVFSGTGTLTQTESAKFTLTGVEAGQYSVTVEITKTEGTSQDWFYLSATGLGDAVFLTEGNTTSKYYGVVSVDKDGELTISSTSPNTLTVNVSLDTLFMNDDSGYSLGNVHLASNYSPISIDLSGTNARSFTVQVDLGERLLKDNERLTAEINDVSAELVAQTAGLALYSATITLPQTVTSATTLTIESTVIESEDESVVGSIALFPLGTVTPMTTNTATAENVPVWETAIFSYTPSATGYKSVAISSTASPLYTSTTVSTVAGVFSGTPVTGENYPVYLLENTTYYFEVMLSGTDEEGNDVGYTSADLTITISDWKAPAEVTAGTFAMPVTPTEEFSTKLNVTTAGQYSLSIINVPFDYYDGNVVIMAHLGTSGIELNRDNNYSAIVDIAGGETIYFTTSENTHTTLTFSLSKYEETHYIELNHATEITVPANGSITYTVQAALAGTYSVVLANANSAISVYGENERVAMIPAGQTAGGFVVRYDGVDYGIEFRNSSDEAVKITATVSVDPSATLHLGAENSIELSAGQRRSFFMYSLAAGTFELAITPATTTGFALEVDGVPVNFTDGKATITITDEQEIEGIVNFSFVSSGDEVTFTLTVNPTSNTLNVGETITVDTAGAGYEYITTYYAMVEAGKTYALSLALPEGMSVIVTQNGTDLVFYGGMAGAFTAETTGYVTLRFSCYNYGDKTEFTATFNNAGVMSVFEEVSVTVNANDKQYSYVTYLYDGRYHFDLSNSAVKVAINGTVLTEDSFELYNYGKVTVTFIYDGEGAFNATLVPDYTLTLGTTANITLDGWVNRSYYTNLNAGTYEVTIADASNLQLQIDGVLINAVNGNTYVFTVTENGYHAITFMNTDYNTVTFKATVTTANLLVLDDDNEVTIEAGMHSKTYYISLEAGQYTIELTDGTNIQVTVNGEVVIASGDTEGNFTISTDYAGYVQIIFTTESDVAVTFTVNIYEA